MTEAKRETRSAYTDPMARRYALIGGIAVVVLWLNLSERAVGAWVFAAPLVAAAGIAFRWASAPVFVLLSTAIALMIAHQESRFMRDDNLAGDAVLCASVLIYMLAQCRITALAQSIFPADGRRMLAADSPRREGLPPWLEFFMALTVVPYVLYLFLRKPTAKAKPKLDPRDGKRADGDELFWALFTVGALTCAVVAIWQLAGEGTPPFRIIPRQWQFGVTLWVMLAGLLAARLYIGVAAGRAMTAAEARLLLADALWRETRREQHRVAHWIAAHRAADPARDSP